MPSHPVVPCFASFNYATGEVVEFMPGDRSPPSDEAHNSNGDESPSLGSRQFPGQSAASSRHRSSRSRSGQRRSRRRRHRMLPVYRYFKPRTLQFTAASVPSSLKSTAHERNGPSMINLAPGTVMASDAHRTLASSSLRSCDPSNDSSGPDPDHKDSQPVELAAGRPLASRPSAAAATPMAVKAASMARLYSSPQSMPRKPPSTTLELLQPRPGLSSTKSSLSRDPFSQSRALRKIDLRSPLYYSAASVPALATPGVFRDEVSSI
ncbi:unnamed protein product [Protopolystoma xenopodis]|uniref:Uncharacterized protein n=1 Tax=Protopolystoma xenopodis TaxID=117903 RepID=A0A3S4ZF89_9PLAT|nr:unnamed protein product [Protopolystoma xenopodis]